MATIIKVEVLSALILELDMPRPIPPVTSTTMTFRTTDFFRLRDSDF